MMTHFFPEAFNCSQERVVGRAFKLRQHRPTIFDWKCDDAARVDRLSLVRDKDIVEVEKIQRADRLQLSDVRARGADMRRDKCAKIALAQKLRFLPARATS